MSATGRSRADGVDRELTEHERHELTLYTPGLQVVQAYLDLVDAWPTVAGAEAQRAPLAYEHLDFDSPRVGVIPAAAVAVNPTYVLEWARGRPGPAATTTGLSLNQVVNALEFMGGRAAVTVHGADDTTRYRRAGMTWWRLSQEMTRRLRYGPHTPVLTALSGRPIDMIAAGPAPMAETTSTLRRAAAAVHDVGLMRELLVAYLRGVPFTMLHATAVERGAPLLSRVSGRPRRLDSDPKVVRDSVLIRREGLSQFSRRPGPAMDWPALTPQQAAQVLRLLAEQRPEWVGAVAAVAAIDTDGSLHRRGWFRVSLAGLGLSGDDLEAGLMGAGAEFARWRAARIEAARAERQRDSERAARLRVAETNYT